MTTSAYTENSTTSADTTGDNCFADAGDPMGREIVEHDNVARPQGWGENLADVDPEGIAIHGAVEHPRRSEPREPQAGDEEPAPAKAGVMVFQCPNGALSRQRSPTGDQP